MDRLVFSTTAANTASDSGVIIINRAAFIKLVAIYDSPPNQMAL
jgi:hypothetical protein